MTLGKVPLRGLLIYDFGNCLRGLMYDFRESSFERIADICENKCL